MHYQDWLEAAQEAADRAGPVILGHFRQKLNVQRKGDLSPVTIADQQAERVIKEVLEARFPGHGIFGEEEGGDKHSHRQLWVIDPIDGTRSFITGYPLFCSLIALVEDGVSVFGQVDVPAIGERFWAACGQKAWFNGREIQTSGCERLDDAFIYIAGHKPMDKKFLKGYEALMERGKEQRYGYDAYIYALLAAGHLDVMVETDLEIYDFLSVVPVIEEAGGVVTDWQGHRLGLESKGDIAAAATPRLHEELLKVLNG